MAGTASQLAGQWYANLLQLGPIIPKNYTRAAVQTMLTLNGNSSPYGAVNSVFPSRKIDQSNRHSRNIFPGISYSLAALAIQEGFIKEGMALAEKTWKNIAWTQRNPWNQPDLISSSTGRYLFGDSYMRNMVIWAIPFALSKHKRSIMKMLETLGSEGGVSPFR